MEIREFRRLRIERALEHTAERFIRQLIRLQPTLREGTVLTVGPPPYRRVDGDGRAVVYVRCRPKKLVVRVDISGLWMDGGPCSLAVDSSAGVALILRHASDADRAAQHVSQVVERTRFALNQPGRVG